MNKKPNSKTKYILTAPHYTRDGNELIKYAKDDPIYIDDNDEIRLSHLKNKIVVAPVTAPEPSPKRKKLGLDQAKD